MSLDYNSIGNRIRIIRRRQMITQEELAFQIGTSPTHISNIENGKKKPSLEKLSQISEVLGVSISNLIYNNSDIANNASISDLVELIALCPPKNQQRLLETLSSIIQSFITD